MNERRWSPHDLALWSNSAVNHLATFDFTGPREGDRAVVVGEKPVSSSLLSATRLTER